jgi:DNA-directed RNA polymerase specialized sigma24 family protein
VRLLALLVRQQFENQTQMIIELDRLGFTPTRIADLVGTTPDTAKVTAHRARQAQVPRTSKAQK